MVLKNDQPKKKDFLRILAILFLIILPSLVVLLGASFFYRRVVEEEPGEEAIVFIEPSQALENKSEYKDQHLTLRGKVSQEPVVCEKVECPEDDPCCGCKQERNLIIADAGTVIVQETAWRLRLLDQEGKALCQREPGNCEYLCSGWEEGSVYDVTGTFWAEPPPPGSGWRMYMDFYFEVEEKSLVRKTGITDLPRRIIKGIGELFEQVKQSASYYVLP